MSASSSWSSDTLFASGSPRSWSHESISSGDIDEFGGNKLFPTFNSNENWVRDLPEESNNFTVSSNVEYTMKVNDDDFSAILVMNSQEDLCEFPYVAQNRYHVETCDNCRDRVVVFYDGEDGPFELFSWSTETMQQKFARFVEEEGLLSNPITVYFRVGDKNYRHFFLPSHKVERIAVYGNYYATSSMFEMIHIMRKIATSDFSTTLQDFGIASDDVIRIMSK